MKALTLAALLALASVHCINDDVRQAKIEAYWQDADHAQSDCNVCVLTFRQVMVEIEGFTQRCIQYTDDQSLCCPQRGDSGCPIEAEGYELDACSDSINGVCQDSGHADEACVAAVEDCD